MKRPPSFLLFQKKGAPKLESVPLGELERFFGIFYTAELIFPSEEIRLEVAAHCPYLLRSRWFAGEYYDKKPILNPTDAISIRWIDEVFGYGVFAEEPLDQGVCIGEYTGIVRKLDTAHPELNGYCFQYPTKWRSRNYFVIDAQRTGNFTRFLNHSDKPNLDLSCTIEHRIIHLQLITSRPIEIGEQLTFNYGPDYWVKRSKTCNFSIHLNSAVEDAKSRLNLSAYAFSAFFNQQKIYVSCKDRCRLCLRYISLPR